MLTDAVPLPQRVQALHQRAHALRHADARVALQLCREALALARQGQDAPGEAWSLLRLALCQCILGLDGDDAPLPTLQAALALLRAQGDRAGEAEAHNLLGNLQMRGQQLDDAMVSHQQCLGLRRQLGDALGEATSLLNIALLHHDLGQLPEALDHAHRSLALAEAQGDAAAITYALNSLGRLLAELGETAQAQRHLVRALGLVAETDDRALECTLCTNLGQLLTDSGQLHLAAAPLQQAVALAQATGNAGDLAEAQAALAQWHLVCGRPGLAAPLLQQALQLARTLGDHRLQARLLLALAGPPQPGTNPAPALALLQQALQQAQAARALPLLAQAHEQLSLAHEAAGDLHAALQHSRSLHAVSQQLHGVQAQRRIRAMLARQAAELSEQVVQAERQRNAALADALAQARQADAERRRLLEELQAQAVLLQQLAHEDGLTGVANRRWLDLQLQRELDRARRFGHALTVAMVDIDHFKAINDRHSHAVGDAALCAVARLLKAGCRATDLVGRYGGEEFLLLLVETSTEAAHGACELLRQRVAGFDWPRLRPGLAGVTVSIGLAGLQPDDDAAALLARADAQLYRAKQAGRNRVCR